MTPVVAAGPRFPVAGGGSGRAQGFTLVEVVVALAILSLLMTTVLAALRAFGNTQESLERVTGRTDEIRAVSSFLRESLEAAIVAGADSGGSDLGFGGKVEGEARESSYFKGDETGFAWKARVVFGESYGGTFLVRVARVEDRLELGWMRPPDSTASVDWESQQARVLVPQLQELQVAYRARGSDEWRPVWTDQRSPELVRMTIRANDRYWPELIMAVQR